MTEQELITQLKILRNIRPDKEWVNLTRAHFNEPATRTIFHIFSFVLPRPASVAILASAVALVSGVHIYKAGLIDLEVGSSPALTASLRHVSDETAKEVAQIQEIVEKVVAKEAAKKNTTADKETSAYTVVFNKDAEERENFQTLLKERIETKIAFFKDLFNQLDDGERVREITLNPRRFEENFKGVVGERGEQVLELLNEAEQALEEGDLITALDLVNAIEKLIKD